MDKQALTAEQELASRFESLGYNCEFGFVQHQCGWEQGGLLRWALAMPGPLVQNLRSGFKGLYEFRNLVPRNAKMVTDTATGIGFHSEMRSTGGAFDDPEPRRRRIHAGEAGKIGYLRDRFLGQLAEGRQMFVFKYNPGLPPETVGQLAGAIAARGPGRLLYVTAADRPEEVGTVSHAGGNLYLGRVARVWWRDPDPGNIDYPGWVQLMRNCERFLR
ncbi:hypothetical protein [Poseidonocella sp. HB161398]|uniref:hypothetical protein n=1 Tax=Poseidonocella sp. HB161398 TaxID=2320855 RepID=UPI0011080EF3|nr:hypothetical protein [Poseidonocella sp. HB161398]